MALNCGDTGLTTAACSSFNVFMNISPRDVRILRMVGRFGLVTSEQIRVIEFAENRSKSPSSAVLLRLTNAGLLRRLSPRTVGGWSGGSGQYVYQLGSKGWAFLRREGRYTPLRSIDMHRIAIAETYVQTVEAERAGHIRINEVVTEPDCHQVAGGVLLTPDLYIFADVRAAQARRRIWVEVDMATERRKQITDKLARYRHAYRAWADEFPGQPFPRVVFVAVDEERERELNSIIREMPESARQLFAVMTAESFPQVWTS